MGRMKTIVKTADTAWKMHTFVSHKIDFISIRNEGSEDIAIAFGNDDKDAGTEPEYRTIKPQTDMPTVKIFEGLKMHYKRLTGTGTHRLEINAWG